MANKSPKEALKIKNPAAVALARLGASKGGQARAKALSPKQRSTIARNAALARAKTMTAADRLASSRKANAAKSHRPSVLE